MRGLLRPDKLLGLSFMFTGVGLFAHILTNLALSVTVLLAFLAAATFFIALYRLGEVDGTDLRRRIQTGLVAGALGVLAYDASRTITWYFWLSNAFPFEAFRHFGFGLLGEDASPTAALIAGTGFHLCNGLLFAVTFTVWLGSRGRGWALGWALMLETFTLLLYPDWLAMRRYSEFVQVSIIGHVCYGLVLGEVNARRQRADARGLDSSESLDVR